MNKRFVSLWLPAITWCLLIFFLSSIPNLKTNLGFWDLILRKIAHLAEYAVLFLLCWRALSGTFEKLASLHAYTIAALFSVLYAASDEFHQSFVPTRGPSLSDVGIDAVGVLIGIILIAVWPKDSRVMMREHT